MSTYNDLIAEQRGIARANQASAKSILDKVAREGREFLTDAEDQQMEKYMARAEQANGNMERLKAEQAEAAKADADMHVVTPNGNLPAAHNRARQTASFSVTRNERTYNPGTDEDAGMRNNPGGSFLLDVARAKMGDPLAQDRLTRHQREEFAERPWLEQRSVGTVNFSGLVVPVYAVNDVAPAVSAARPLADVMNSRELPDSGMSVNLSRITQPTSAGIQSAENATLANQDIDDTLLTLNVQTAGGYVQLSRQAVERGVLTEDVTTADLLTRVAVALETQLIGQASTGLAASATSQTYTNATVDTTAVPAFLKQLPQAQSAIDTALQSRTRPAYVIVHPRRFNWLTAAVSANFPVLSGVSTSPLSQGVQLTDSYGPSVRAVLANGAKIVVDANVTTAGLATALTGGTQDHVYVISAQESYLYEPRDRAVLIRAEQPQAPSLGILFVAYEYFAFTFQRYTTQSVLVNGTGLATPSFA